jgi:uncharacterized protein (TIGR02147 family)
VPKRTINIYAYEDYRAFLAEFVDTQRRRDPQFSLRAFASRAGFGSHSYLPALIAGERSLTPESAERLIPALGLNEREADYFRALVKYTQTEAVDEKQRSFQRMNAIRRNVRFYKLRKDHYAYLDEWYYPVIRELAVMAPWDCDYGRLAALCDPPITTAQARKAVDALLSMGLIEPVEGGFRQTHAAVTVEGWPAHLVRKARSAYIQLAVRASDTRGPHERHISGATVALDRRTYRRVSRLLDAVYETVLRTAAKLPRAERVYQLNLQLFPLSKSLTENAGEVRESEEGGHDA